MPGQVRARVHINPKVVQRAKDRLHEHGAVEPKRLSVGIHEADGAHSKIDYEGHSSDATLAEVAIFHEFGERSWLRTWFDQNRSRLIQEMVAAMRKQYGGDSSAITTQGDAWAVELQGWIEYGDGNLKALQSATIAEKQRTGLASPETPLFATGQLVAAIKSMIDGESK